MKKWTSCYILPSLFFFASCANSSNYGDEPGFNNGSTYPSMAGVNGGSGEAIIVILAIYAIIGLAALGYAIVCAIFNND